MLTSLGCDRDIDRFYLESDLDVGHFEEKSDPGEQILRDGRLTGRPPCFSHAWNPAAAPSPPVASCLRAPGTRNPPPFPDQPADRSVQWGSSAGRHAEEVP